MKYPVSFVPPNSFLSFIKRTFIAPARGGDGKRSMGLYKCKCGNTAELCITKVKNGHIKSCGCIKKLMFYKHGYARHPLYVVLQSMKTRCYYKKSSGFKNYGAIGVRVCDEWLNNSEKFIEWALLNGWKKGLQIDKDIIPNRLGIEPKLYSPEMCCIVSSKVNNRTKKTNRNISLNNTTKTITEWSENLGIHLNTLRNRLDIMKLSPQEALVSKYFK